MIRSLLQTRPAVSYKFKYMFNSMAQQFHFQVVITINENMSTKDLYENILTVLFIIAQKSATQMSVHPENA